MHGPNQTDPVNEWQTEEKRLPTIILDPQGNPQVGERVIKQRYVHVPLFPNTICSVGDHAFDFVDGGRHRDGQGGHSE